MISTVVNTIIRICERKLFSECYLEMISVSLKFITQKLLHFILVMNFMLPYSTYQRLLMSKMLCYNESEFRDKFTDSGESILMDLELHVLSF